MKSPRFSEAFKSETFHIAEEKVDAEGHGLVSYVPHLQGVDPDDQSRRLDPSIDDEFGEGPSARAARADGKLLHSLRLESAYEASYLPCDTDDLTSEYLRDGLIESTIEDLPLVAARCQIECPQVFNDYDRLSAEAELRFSVVPPLALIAIVLFVTWHWFAVVGLLVVVLLLRSGIASQDRAKGVLANAVVFGSTAPPTVEALRGFRTDLGHTPTSDGN
jgi:hypothetical protein